MKAWYLINTAENLAIILKLFKGITKIDLSGISKKVGFKRDLTPEQKAADAGQHEGYLRKAGRQEFRGLFVQ